MIDALIEIFVFFVKYVLILGSFLFIFVFILKAIKDAVKLSKKKDNQFTVEFKDLKEEIRCRKHRTLLNLDDAESFQAVDKDKKHLYSGKFLDKEKELEKKRIDELKVKQALGEFCPRNLYIIEFSGNTKASGLKRLINKIDYILDVATEEDEIILKLKSPGGMVNIYGLAAAQLMRIRERKIKLTICVDEVAASGGYMMACVADKIVAAPFAYIGSIGVFADFANFHKVLNKYDIDYELFTAGKYKRTLTMLGENTDEGREKFKRELECIHTHFKQLVLSYRPALKERIDDIATGESWLAEDALKLGLIDEISTSDAYIDKRIHETFYVAFKVCWKKKKKKSMLLKAKKLIRARTWVKALHLELSKNSSVDKLIK